MDDSDQSSPDHNNILIFLVCHDVKNVGRSGRNDLVTEMWWQSVKDFVLKLQDITSVFHRKEFMT